MAARSWDLGASACPAAAGGSGGGAAGGSGGSGSAHESASSLGATAATVAATSAVEPAVPAGTGLRPVQLRRVEGAPDCGKNALSAAAAAGLLENPAAFGYRAVVVADARYGFEHAGGCIVGAHNVPLPSCLERLLTGAGIDWSRTALLMHCEFSSRRAPRQLMNLVRLRARGPAGDGEGSAGGFDRAALPRHVYLIQGGYKAFCAAAPQLCEPAGAYRSERHPSFSSERHIAHAAAKAAWKAWGREVRAQDDAELQAAIAASLERGAGAKRARQHGGGASGSSGAAEVEDEEEAAEEEEVEVEEGVWLVQRSAAPAASDAGWDDAQLQAALEASLSQPGPGAAAGPASAAREEEEEAQLQAALALSMLG